MNISTSELQASNIDWSAPPVCCPRCGSEEIDTFGEWTAKSADDADLVNTITEYQCRSCEGASFWM